ncbi:hypothetical protein FRB90_001587 [Tulasnella sp. 427]|nr:hypothetical protein FRB90_001587 [Tulasnella sp. 427]
MDSPRGKDQIPLLQELAGVSKYWLRTIRTTPSLWTIIDGSWNISRVELFLKKSAPLPLSIKCGESGNDSGIVDTFYNVASNYSHRWRSIVVDGPPLKTSINLSGHALRDVQIYSMDRDYRRVSIVLRTVGTLRWRLPPLRLTPCGLRLEGKFTNLEILRLENIEDVPSCHQIMTALALSPKLRILQLHRWQPNTNEDLPYWLYPIELPRLEHIECADIPEDVTEAIAEVVMIPNCNRIVLYLSAESDFYRLNHVQMGIKDRMFALLEKHRTISIIFGCGTCSPKDEVDCEEVVVSAPRTMDRWDNEQDGVHLAFREGSEEDQASHFKWFSQNLTSGGCKMDIALNTSPSHKALRYLAKTTILTDYGPHFSATAAAKPIIVGGWLKWPLPNLNELDLEDVDLTAEELRAY